MAWTSFLVALLPAVVAAAPLAPPAATPRAAARQSADGVAGVLPILRLEDDGAGVPRGWQLVEMGRRRPTRYEIVDLDGRRTLQASSRDSAAALMSAIRFDPRRRGLLRWEWRVEAAVTQGNPLKKGSDDYAARLFVIFGDDSRQRPSLHDQRTLCYVWSSARLLPESLFTSPYADNVVMIVVRSGEALTGAWVKENRDLLADFRRAFGDEVGDVVGIALMTDTDDTGGETTAYFASIEALGRDRQ